MDRSPTLRSASCERGRQQKLSTELGRQTYVVLCHVGEERGEILSEVAAQNGGDGSDEVASRADESGVVLGLLSKAGGCLGFSLVVNLAGSLSPENEVEVGAKRLDVCRMSNCQLVVLAPG